MDAYTKSYTEIHFCISYKTKSPAEAEPKICQQKRKQILSGLPCSHRSLAMTFQGLTAPQGERSDHARMGIAEP